MKNKLMLIFLLLATLACHAEESIETCSISGENLKYILALYDDIQEYPLYVFENNSRRLKEIDELIKTMNFDFKSFVPETRLDVDWFRFYEDFAMGRPYIHILDLSDYKIEVQNVDGKVVVNFKRLKRGMWLSEFTYYFDKEGNILERYLKGSPLKPLN